MCGIFGYVRRQHLPDEVVKRAFRIQAHRGPDDQGEQRYDLNGWKIFFGHQRLSIIDLSRDGHQPMVDKKSGDVLVYNGELYNFLELKEELGEAGPYISNSDTEVFLRGLLQWGAKPALERYNGMWGFCWFRRETSQLFLARDRMGEKPLHIFRTKDEFFFASELKTLLCLLDRTLSLNHETIGEFVLESMISRTSSTFFHEIEQLRPADLATVDFSGETLEFASDSYWTCSTDPIDEEESVAQKTIHDLFLDSVSIRLRSDVPVGILLSGGIDSSAIAAVASKLKTNKLDECQLLCGVSGDSRFDESVHIDRMAKHLGQSPEKVVLEFDAISALKAMEECVYHNDIPITNYSMVAYYKLMERAKELGITVILSGQGADELLCGYRKYLGFYWQSLLRSGKVFSLAKSMVEFGSTGTLISQFNLAEAGRYLPSFQKRKINVSGEALRSYRSLEFGLRKEESVQDRQLRDLHEFSVPGLTHYEDRLSMAQSREIRLPFLDHRLIEYLIPLTIERKLARGWSKYGFRKAMEPYMPNPITWRKDKQGFVNPQSQWLKNEWKGSILETFSKDALIFKYKLIDRKLLLDSYKEYCQQSGKFGRVWYREILCPLTLEYWLRQNEGAISF